MDFKVTDRGFRWLEFKDHYGSECAIYESSLATEDCIWLGNLKCSNGEESHAMHLTQDMAASLIPLLQHFVETGVLPDGEIK